jgi:DNA primase
MFMEDEIEVLVELLSDFLGNPRQHYESKGQISFDCPVCADEKGLDDGDGKGNLEINYGRHVYKCWACSETHGTHGTLGKLFDQYATKEQKKIYDLIKPEELKKQEVKINSLKLPEGFVTFKDSNPRFIPHAEAYRYLISRGITDEMIEKYNIGYTVHGDFAYRIIIPSYDKNGKLNYFIGRSWVPRKMKYKNPSSVPKDQIIFNENLIEWNKDIYLVEGAFDSFFLPNPLVMLGKKMSQLILETLYNKSNGNIIICVDGDAWEDGLKMFHELNGGRLYNKIKIVRLPKDKDVCDLRGNIDEYYYEIK